MSILQTRQDIEDSSTFPLHFDFKSRSLSSGSKKRVRPRDVAIEISCIVIASIALGVLAALTKSKDKVI